MSGDKPTLGSQLRALRARRKLTLKEMSEQTGIPFSTLSKVEHDRLTLTYEKLQLISERLRIPMSELFSGPDAPAKAEVIGRRSIGRTADALRVETPNYDSYYLCPELRKKHMIPMLTHITAKSMEEFGELVHHSGEEFSYVVEGKVAVVTEFYDTLVLSPGESIYIDSKMGHAYLVGDEAESATLLTVCSSSQEDLIASVTSGVAVGGGSQPSEPARRVRKQRSAA